jgi:hypothetical protein
VQRGRYFWQSFLTKEQLEHGTSKTEIEAVRGFLWHLLFTFNAHQISKTIFSFFFYFSCSFSRAMSDLHERLAAVSRELDETMALTFRARGAKLEALTAKLEQLEAEQKSLELQIASGPKSSSTSSSGAVVASSVVVGGATSASPNVAPVAKYGYSQPAPVQQPTSQVKKIFLFFVFFFC